MGRILYYSYNWGADPMLLIHRVNFATYVYSPIVDRILCYLFLEPTHATYYKAKYWSGYIRMMNLKRCQFVQKPHLSINIVCLQQQMKMANSLQNFWLIQTSLSQEYLSQFCDQLGRKKSFKYFSCFRSVYNVWHRAGRKYFNMDTNEKRSIVLETWI